MLATKQAQEILDNATNEANALRMSAMSYTDGQLKSIEDLLVTSIDTTKARSENLISSLQSYLDVVVSNRTQLYPPDENDLDEEPVSKESSSKEVSSKEDEIDVNTINVSADEE